MTESKPPNNQQDPATRLKNEALAQRPQFSQSLHERICEAVRENQHADKRNTVYPLKTRKTSLAKHSRSFATAAAACLVVVAVGLLWWNHTSQQQIALPIDSPNPLITLADAAGQTTVDAGRAAENALAANRWGRLDEDAKTAAKMILNSLPIDMLARKSNEHGAMSSEL